MTYKLISTVVAIFLITATASAQGNYGLRAAHRFDFKDGYVYRSDSTEFKYKSTNNNIYGGQDFIDYTVGYDTSHYIVYSIYMLPNYRHERTSIYHYDAAGRKIRRYGKIYDHWANQLGPLQLFEEYYYNHAGDSIITTSYHGYTKGITRRLYEVYDANKNLVKKVDSMYRGFLPHDPLEVSIEEYTYSTNNELMTYEKEYTYIFAPSRSYKYRFNYHYNTNNQLDTMFIDKLNVAQNLWDTNGRVSYQYNSNGLLAIETAEGKSNNNTTMMQYSTKKEYRYNNQNKLVAKEYSSWNRNAKLWAEDNLDTFYTLATPAYTEVHVLKQWRPLQNGYVNHSRERKTYNSINEIDYRIRDYWDTATKSWTYMSGGGDSTQFYYGEYHTPTELAQVSANDRTLQLYPNPVSDLLNINLDTKTTYTIAIYDINGRLTMQMSEANGATHKTIPVAHLPAGQYILKIISAGGEQAKQFSIIR